MEARLLFSGFLLAFCGVVLAYRLQGVTGWLTAFLGGSRQAQAPVWRAAAPGGHDWYVFFRRDQVTGPAANDRKPAVARTGSARARRPDARPRQRVC